MSVLFSASVAMKWAARDGLILGISDAPSLHGDEPA
jgi:hypothetical protein